jgi:opacity protein-like surface antigen
MALVMGARHAAADDPLGLYAGVEVGQSHIVADGQVIETPAVVYFRQGSFDEHHSAFQVMAGIRPISVLGAELDYLDLGSPSGGFNAHPADVSIKGIAAFGVLYLPVPVVDIYLKAGLARMQSDLSGIQAFGPNCASPGTIACPQYLAIGPFDLERTNTSGAAGVGAQYKFGPVAARAEYERFSAAGEHPSLLAVGLTWSF